MCWNQVARCVFTIESSVLLIILICSAMVLLHRYPANIICLLSTCIYISTSVYNYSPDILQGAYLSNLWAPVRLKLDRPTDLPWIFLTPMPCGKINPDPTIRRFAPPNRSTVYVGAISVLWPLSMLLCGAQCVSVSSLCLRHLQTYVACVGYLYDI